MSYLLKLIFILFALLSCSQLELTKKIRSPSSHSKQIYYQNCAITFTQLLEIQGIPFTELKMIPGPGFRIETDDPGYYSEFKNVLRLSDGKKGYEDALEIAQKNPGVKILSADYQFDGIRPDDRISNLAKVHVNNTKSFPIESNSQDLIVMKRGLCTCHDTCTSCGGLDFTKRSEVIGFFSEVIRVLDKSNPKSKAILQGGYFLDYNLALSIYIDVFKHFKNHPDVDLSFIRNNQLPSGERFFGIMIKPKEKIN